MRTLDAYYIIIIIIQPMPFFSAEEVADKKTPLERKISEPTQYISM